jgi:hypothetical protein
MVKAQPVPKGIFRGQLLSQAAGIAFKPDSD